MSLQAVTQLEHLQALAKCASKERLLGSVSEPWGGMVRSEEFFVQLEAIVCALYGAKKGTANVNELCYAVFCAKRGEAESHHSTTIPAKLFI